MNGKKALNEVKRKASGQITWVDVERKGTRKGLNYLLFREERTAKDGKGILR